MYEVTWVVWHEWRWSPSPWCNPSWDPAGQHRTGSKAHRSRCPSSDQESQWITRIKNLSQTCFFRKSPNRPKLCQTSKHGQSILNMQILSNGSNKILKNVLSASCNWAWSAGMSKVSSPWRGETQPGPETNTRELSDDPRNPGTRTPC